MHLLVDLATQPGHLTFGDPAHAHRLDQIVGTIGKNFLLALFVLFLLMAAMFKSLRHAIVASYDHWDRPIVLDALLRRQLGDRAQRDQAAAQ